MSNNYIAMEMTMSCFVMIFGISVFLDVASSEWKHGCDYLNKQYAMGRSPGDGGINFGNEMPEYSFSSIAQLRKFYENTAVPINNDVIEQYLFNSVDSFIQVRRDYRNQSEPFKTFFPYYEMKYLPGCVGSSIAAVPIEIMDRISAKMDKMNQRETHIDRSCYLAAAFGTQTIYTYYEIINNFYRIPKEKYCFHLVGVFRFIVGNRYGYVLFDPYYDRTLPPMIMDDGRLPYQAYANLLQIDTTQYKVFANNKNYIYTYKYRGNIEVDSRVHADSTFTFIIFVGLSYCSFLETTEKYDIVRYQKNLIKRNEDGVRLGGVQFSIAETFRINFTTYEVRRIQGAESRILLFMNTPEGEEVLRVFINCKDIINHLTSNQELSEAAGRAIIQVNQLFQWDYYTFLRKLGEIAEVLEDTDFLKDLLGTRIESIAPRTANFHHLVLPSVWW